MFICCFVSLSLRIWPVVCFKLFVIVLPNALFPIRVPLAVGRSEVGWIRCSGAGFCSSRVGSSPRIGSSPGNLRKMCTVWSVTCWWWWWWMLVYASSLFYLYFPEDGWSGIGIKTQLVWVDLSFSCVLIRRGIIGIHCVSRGERRGGFLDMTNNSCVYIIHSWYAWRKPKLFFINILHNYT